MDRAEILQIWQGADRAFNDASLREEITMCLPKSGFRLLLPVDMDIVFVASADHAEKMPALENFGLPARIYEQLKTLFEHNIVLIDALRKACPMMFLDFSKGYFFWLPREFWHAVSSNMLQRLVRACGTSESLLAIALERDLGL